MQSLRSFCFQMRKEEDHDDPFQHTKNQERIDVKCDGEKDGVHDVERQMEHYRQQETLLAAIEEPGDVERERHHE